ncbi:translation initiation factor IF-2-like [Vulpes lagopus]|uniref:translation initiation factor IF-2-like n=1 Tax=Vulpes lagopus TaxID=494514 RepID=UPI001BC97394|nr:translation initiation factor IF-2-like [Vulpes lagopus]
MHTQQGNGKRDWRQFYENSAAQVSRVCPLLTLPGHRRPGRCPHPDPFPVNPPGSGTRLSRSEPPTEVARGHPKSDAAHPAQQPGPGTGGVLWGQRGHREEATGARRGPGRGSPPRRLLGVAPGPPSRRDPDVGLPSAAAGHLIPGLQGLPRRRRPAPPRAPRAEPGEPGEPGEPAEGGEAPGAGPALGAGGRVCSSEAGAPRGPEAPKRWTRASAGAPPQHPQRRAPSRPARPARLRPPRAQPPAPPPEPLARLPANSAKCLASSPRRVGLRLCSQAVHTHADAQGCSDLFTFTTDSSRGASTGCTPARAGPVCSPMRVCYSCPPRPPAAVPGKPRGWDWGRAARSADAPPGWGGWALGVPRGRGLAGAGTA